MGSQSCCICLEGPGKEVMFLIACGCKGGWFHASCESQWLNAYNYPYSCPTCRTLVPFTTFYSFSYNSGEEQKLLYNTLKMVAVEIILFGFKKRTYFLPSQSLTILITPFIIYSNHSLPHFLECIWVKNIVQYTLLGFASSDIILDVSKYFGIIYILFLYITHYLHYVDLRKNYRHLEPLMPYAVYRQIHHAASIAESPSNTCETS